MVSNHLMNEILENNKTDEISRQYGYPIRKKLNQAGQPYWSVGKFNGIGKGNIKSDVDLTALEWEGNEVYISMSSDISALVSIALGIMEEWKVQMKKEYAYQAFDICLSIDYGDEDVPPSVTLRFWAVRGNVHYIDPLPDELDKFSQPILIEQVNY